MAESKGGLYITFGNRHRETLREAAEAYGRFSFELSSADWNLEPKNMFVVSLAEDPNLIAFAAIGRRKGGPHNTGVQNIELSGLVYFEPLALDVTLQQIPATARATIKDREGQRGKWFPPVAWRAFLDRLKSLRGDVAPQLEALWERVNAEDILDRSNQAQRLAMQRDAIGLSLDIAGLPEVRRREFRKALPANHLREAQSFIELMDNQPPQERTLVDHDQSVFEDVIARGDAQNATFTSGLRRLRVWTVDRGEVERSAGVDLVFLNRDYNSLLLLQYKCMERDSILDSWSYRPDPQFDRGIRRMEKIDALIGENIPAEAELTDLRLHLGSLYFKFCKRLPLSQQDGELAEGMVMSLATTQMFMNSGVANGPRGGRSIGYANCNRYLNNSLFAALARDGWIGSRGLSDQQYAEILGLVQRQDHYSLIFAEASARSRTKVRI